MTIAELLYSIETEIIVSIAKELKGGAIGTAEWQADRLARMGAISRRAAALISAYRQRVEEGTAQGIELSAIQATLKADARALAAKRSGALVKELPNAIVDPNILATIQAWQGSARSQMNLAMAQLAQNAGRVYSDIVSKTTLSVLTGAKSGTDALRQTIEEWSAKGVPSIVDRAGRQWTSEAYVNAVLRSNASRVASEVSLRRAEEYETDLVEVSSHPGSRPTHYEYQGQIFSRSGTSTKYPPLAETGWGDAAGVGGVNCGHILYPFWEGVSIAREPSMSESENETLYETSQEQRGLERNIRSAKRDLAVMEALGDKNGIFDAKATIREAQAAMRGFVEDTGRTRRREREQVYD
jgi:hypothetical protein